MRVGRLIAAVALIAAVPVVAAAQGAIAWGAVGGGNLSTVSATGTTNFSSQGGVTLGVFMRWPIDDMWSVHTELNFVTKGTNFRDTQGGGADQGSLNLNYLELPVLLRIRGGEPNFHLFGEAGPSLAHKLGCSVAASHNGVPEVVSCNDIGPFKTTDVGLAIGGGIEFPTGSNELSLGVRYTFGLTALADNRPGASSTDVKSRNLQFLAGFRF